MDIANLAIWLIVLLAIGAVVYWFMTKVNIPAPFSYIIYAVLAIVAIIALVHLAGIGGSAPLRVGLLVLTSIV